jgi:anthranilate synthase/aminodeoxychorismate synthase-like glutamine amidotransferase
MTILLIDNYDSFSFNLVQTLKIVSNSPVDVRRNDKITLADAIALKPTAIVISPGPGHPANQRDFGINSELIRNQSSLGCPILGVCLGHQGIVHTLGGEVVQSQRVMHGKTSQIRLCGDSALFAGCQSEFPAMRYHSLIALDESLPTCLRVTARDTTSNAIMAIEHESAPIFGLQFHPESIGTPDGRRILKNFVDFSMKQTH